MTRQGPLRPSELAAFLAGQRHLTREDQLGLALHLAIGCTDCWRVLNNALMSGDVLRQYMANQDVEPETSDIEIAYGIRRYLHKYDPALWRIPFFSLGPSEAKAEPESWPLHRALRRIGFVRSWPTLSADHLSAVRRVREEVWGFGRLLIEEADVLIEELSPDPYGFERLLDLPRRLVDALTAADPSCRIGWELKARLELARAHGSIYESREEMPAALERAGWYLRRGTRSTALRVELLLAQARRAYFKGEAGRGDRCVEESLELLGASESLRRLEVYLTAVKHQDLDELWRTGNPGHVRYALVKCLRCSRDLQSDPDPIRRLSGLLRLADLGLSFRLVVEMRLGRRPNAIPALAALAGRLEAHLAELEAFADASIVEKVRRVIASIRYGSEDSSSAADDGPSGLRPHLCDSGGSSLFRPDEIKAP